MLTWIYPRFCHRCGEPSELSLCPECLASLRRLPRPICLYCGAPVAETPASADACPSCQGEPRSFHFARPALMRTDDTMKLIYDLKYHRAVHLAAPLALVLDELWDLNPPLREYDDWQLVPVPSTYEHLYMRGYNQAEELARALGRLRNLPVVQPLVRKDTAHSSQTRLSASQRLANAKLAYHVAENWVKSKRTLGPRVLVVDDVFTTGSTARACAKALRSIPGVKRVGVITLVRIS